MFLVLEFKKISSWIKTKLKCVFIQTWASLWINTAQKLIEFIIEILFSIYIITISAVRSTIMDL